MDRLGDLILALGAIRQLTAYCGSEHCALGVSIETASLAAREFPEVEHAALPAFRQQLFPDALRNRPKVFAGPPLEEWLLEIATALLVLTEDPAPTHAAATLDRQLVAPLGGGNTGLFAPWARSKGRQRLRHPEPCSSCDRHCPEHKPYCLTSIGATNITVSTQKALRATPEAS